MIRTHDYSAHEVMIHFYWDILQTELSVKLSCQVYIFSPSFLPPFLSIPHIIMKRPLFILLLPQCILFWMPPRHNSWYYIFSGFLPSIQNLSFSEQTGTSLELLAGVDEWNVGFWMQSHLVYSLKSLPKISQSFSDSNNNPRSFSTSVPWHLI